jgi:hypothetical protein
MDIPEKAWEAFVEWFSGFGNGPIGLVVVAMVLLAGVAAWCLPTMWKDYLEYKKSTKELEPRTKELDLLLIEKMEKLIASKGVEVTVRRPESKEQAIQKRESKKKEHKK